MIRSLLFLHAKPGHGIELLRTLERLGVLAMASEEAGFLGVEVATAVADEDDIVLTGFWASLEHYKRWQAGPTPDRLLAEVESHLATAPVSHVYHVVEAVS